MTRPNRAATRRFTEATISRAPSLVGSRILIVDNRKANCIRYKSFLEEMGADCDWAPGGSAALWEVVRAEQRGAPFDGVLVDLFMPGLDGFSTSQLLRKNGFRGAIIVMSSSWLPGTEQELELAGCNGCVRKNESTAILLELLHDVLTEGAFQHFDSSGAQHAPPPERHRDAPRAARRIQSRTRTGSTSSRNCR